MKNLIFRLGLAASLLAAAVCVPAQTESQVEMSGDANAGKSLVGTESPVAVAKRLAWWTDARFGMFIHWGLYSETGCQWQGQNGKSAHMMYYLKIPLAQYITLAKEFNPTKFNADEWAGLAKEAGMKYMVITAKHHEGFAMYDSKSTYSLSALSPWKRDPMKELKAACDKVGVKFGLYYSLGRDWEDPNAIAGGTHYKENTWDFPDVQHKVFAKYFERKVRPQITEIMTQYHPAIIWFDTPGSISRAESQELIDLIHSMDPNCIVNNRVGNRLGDYLVEEQSIPSTPLSQPWETCMTINGSHWEYFLGAKDFKSPQTCVQNLIKIACMNGNYLLDVGPTGEGIIQDGEVNVLKQMGSWLKINGESIYGTLPSPIGGDWGCCTMKKPAPSDAGTTLYLHILRWPADSKLTVAGVKNEVAAAALLVGGKTLQTASGAEGITIQLPAAPPDPISTTVVLKLKGELKK